MSRKRITTFDQWLEIVTGRLCNDAWPRVASELTEHYQEALAAHLEAGHSQADAEHLALAGLGSARAARRRLERVHLTRRRCNICPPIQAAPWANTSVTTARMP